METACVRKCAYQYHGHEGIGLNDLPAGTDDFCESMWMPFSTRGRRDSAQFTGSIRISRGQLKFE